METWRFSLWRRSNVPFSIISPQGDGNKFSICCPSIFSFSIISPQGDGNMKRVSHSAVPFTGKKKLFQSFPRKGMETSQAWPYVWTSFMNFFNHFPARGWKRFTPEARRVDGAILFQSFPRKGMETRLAWVFEQLLSYFFNHFPARGWKPWSEDHEAFFYGERGFFNHFPARGWKREYLVSTCTQHVLTLFQSFPRKGMETLARLLAQPLQETFSIISPQGDGNGASECRRTRSNGTTLFFFNHFPARGWKLRSSTVGAKKFLNFFNHFPARGWKLHSRDRTNSIWYYSSLFQSFPRKGMETRCAYRTMPWISARLFQSFPRKGMETRKGSCSKLW